MKSKIIWLKEHQNAFDNIKKVVSCEVLLEYPRFDLPFVVHTDASTTQLGSVISQNNRPLAFYSRKLSSVQKRYTTRELELLSIIETLKEFKNILFGHKI